MGNFKEQLCKRRKKRFKAESEYFRTVGGDKLIENSYIAEVVVSQTVAERRNKEHQSE